MEAPAPPAKRQRRIAHRLRGVSSYNEGLKNVSQWHTIWASARNRKTFEFYLLNEVSEGDVTTIQVDVGPVSVFIMGEIVEEGRRLVVSEMHVSARGVSPNYIGIANLRQIARKVMEIGNYDEIIVEERLEQLGQIRAYTPCNPAPKRS